MKHDIVVLTDAALITCIVQRGVADRVVAAAIDAGAQGATVFHARGTGVRQRHLGLLAITVSAEKEVIYVVAANEQANHVFERMYLAANLDTPGMGMIYMSALEKMATYIPPHLVTRHLPERDND
ncbi:MAG: transcriptional regulator [Betaproteobacteria bacterium RIFCSPLOWO2_12_FULL_62_58]|nr:MAG: transcriptional regulator [Betaproteobacteria bacterium RIFCSPLOWO2_02_FULL_62_79]OGA50008.1 MAG: transcriptional regulator [Betaproteobacteria bacterium RIFCSPLOWO2_12_FULL_62_58]